MKIEQYRDEYGAFTYPDGFESLLEGLTIEAQKKYFRIGNGLYLKKPFMERRKISAFYADSIDDACDVRALVVKNGKIAGVIVYDEGVDEAVFCRPEGRYCCRCDSEPDGSGYINHVLYSYLICVSDQFESEQ